MSTQCLPRASSHIFNGIRPCVRRRPGLACHTIGTLRCPFVWGKGCTKRVLEYARLAMGLANVRASRYGIRECSGGYASTHPVDSSQHTQVRAATLLHGRGPARGGPSSPPLCAASVCASSSLLESWQKPSLQERFQSYQLQTKTLVEDGPSPQTTPPWHYLQRAL